MKRVVLALLFGAIMTSCSNNTNNNAPASDNTDSEITSADTDTDEAAYEESYEQHQFPYFFDEYHKSFKVNGGVGIEQFISALNIEGEYGWPSEPTLDKANGYFSYSEEGDGAYRLNASYWNRTDGKKLFILAFYVSEFLYTNQVVTERTNIWRKVRVCHPDPENKDVRLAVESGFLAYIYDADSQMLVPMTESPFNNMPDTNFMMSFKLPQKGKNIEVELFNINDFENSTTHTLKFNGLTFDYVE